MDITDPNSDSTAERITPENVHTAFPVTAGIVQDRSRPEEPLLPTRWTLLALYGAALGMFLVILVPQISTLAVRIAEVAPDGRNAALGVILAVSALISLVFSPVFGMLSDRTTSRWGRRKPWIIGGALVQLIGIVAIAAVGNILFIGVVWGIISLGSTAVAVGLNAFLADRVPESHRGRISAAFNIALQLAPIIGLFIAQMFLATGGTGMALVVPSAVGVALILVYAFATGGDRILTRDECAPFRLSAIPRTYYFSPRKHPDFGWTWLGRFFVFLGFSFVTAYQVYFLVDRVGLDFKNVTQFQLIGTVINTVLLVIVAPLAGSLSDRLQRRKVFVFLSTLLLAVALLVLAFTTTLPLYYVACALQGIAMGVYFAADVAMVTAVLPDRHHSAGKDMAIFAVATNLPQSLAPAIAPMLLAFGSGENYTALFMTGSVFACLGALTVAPIKTVK